MAVAEPVKSQELTLFQIERDLVTLMDARAEADTQARLEGCDEAIAEYVIREVEKVDNIRGYLRHCEVMEAAAAAEADTQKRRAEAWGNRADALKRACVMALGIAGKKSVEGRTGQLSIRANGGKLPLIIDDETAIPSDYTPMTITYPLDKDKLRKALEAGEGVPGAHLAERGVHLVVK
jgi:hypothetical protein